MYQTLKTLTSTFTTDPDRWQGRSTYFDSLFTGRWGGADDDGSYFIETDSHIFEHIMRYLRSGVLPVFYTSVAGHDFALYHSLLVEAEYFGIDRLCRWIREKKYLDAVVIQYVATETRDRSCSDRHTRSLTDGRTLLCEDPRFVEAITAGNVELSMRPVTLQRSHFYCPSGKHEHSTPEYCRSCDSNGIAGGWRSEDMLQWCIVRKEVIFNHDLCATSYTN